MVEKSLKIPQSRWITGQGKARAARRSGTKPGKAGQVRAMTSLAAEMPGRVAGPILGKPRPKSAAPGSPPGLPLCHPRERLPPQEPGRLWPSILITGTLPWSSNSTGLRPKDVVNLDPIS